MLPCAETSARAWSLSRIAAFSGLRVLAWDGDVLYAARGYTLLRTKVNDGPIEWKTVGAYHPAVWRNISSASTLGARLFRDGFHALAVLPSGQVVAAVPGAIAVLDPGETRFRVTHTLQRGTRPLHIAVSPDNHVFWGEYFSNPGRDEVHVYASSDRGATWDVAYTFAKGEIRHVHNIVSDHWENCLWLLTGDEGRECRILRASYDFKGIDVALSGNQQARAVALLPTRDGLFFASDTPLESNHVYQFLRNGELRSVANLDSSSIYGCKAAAGMFFSTMVEPSTVNPTREAALYGSPDGSTWHKALSLKKDRWPMKLFQYGNVFLPDGQNSTDVLAMTSIAVEDNGFDTTLWRVLR
jgi:hypothetical protein